MEGYITTKEAASALGISRQSVVRLIQRGTLPAARIGRAWLVRSAPLKDYASDPRRLLRTRRDLTEAEISRIQQLVIGELEDKGLVTRARRLLSESEQ
jgi:excisionase family DNA binding protein